MKCVEDQIFESKKSSVVYQLSWLLRKNIELVYERQCYPEIQDIKISRPVFIVGIHRTGTTFLHRLMFRSRRFWSPYMYEILSPIWLTENESSSLESGSMESGEDPRIDYAKDVLFASKNLHIFHGIHEFNANEPEEEISFLQSGFASWLYTVRHHMPDFYEWLYKNNSHRARVYEHHYRLMQSLTWHRQRRDGKGLGSVESQGHRPWLFKMPFHLMELENILKVYPDAYFIQTHRDPTQSMASWCHLVDRVRSFFSDIDSKEEMGTELLDFTSDILRTSVEFRKRHPELESRWMDVSYLDFTEKPLATVQNLYEHWDWPLESSSLESMSSWMKKQAEERKREKRHAYSLSDYGLTPERVNEAFAGYLDFAKDKGIRLS